MPLYSHSRISSFENCPLQYSYRYIDRIRMDVEGVEAFVGKVVHEVLEALYKDVARARAADAGAFTEMFDALWKKRLSPAVRIVRENMTLEDYRALGARCVEGFYARYHPFDGGEVLGCEQRVEFGLDREGRYRMVGFIDRIDRVAPDVIEIHDYKTGSLPRAGALKYDRQLTLYEVALRERYEGLREVRHVWHYLAHGKEFVERRTAEDLARARLAAIRSIRNIEGTVEFEPRVSALCSWCEYQGICPQWASRPEGARPGRSAPLPAAARAEAAGPPELAPGSDQYLLFGGRSSP